MKNLILGAAAGYLTARYLIFSMEREEYVKKEGETIDKIKNKVHDLLDQYAPDLSTEEKVKKVDETTDVTTKE